VVALVVRPVVGLVQCNVQNARLRHPQVLERHFEGDVIMPLLSPGRQHFELQCAQLMHSRRSIRAVVIPIARVDHNRSRRVLADHAAEKILPARAIGGDQNNVARVAGSGVASQTNEAGTKQSQEHYWIISARASPARYERLVDGAALGRPHFTVTIASVHSRRSHGPKATSAVTIFRPGARTRTGKLTEPY